MGTEDRADPRGYVQAVAAKLAELGFGNGGAVPVDRPGERRRVLVIRFDSVFDAENINFADAEALHLGWDEERGWTLQEVHPGKFRPYKIDYYNLRLGLIPEPAEVAEVVKQMLAGDLWLGAGEGPRLRRSADDDVDLEATLAVYPLGD
ncbi:DUF6292 family protein [Nonomuraea sp. NBC_01738]|uniref:DUF6292 family protein n=1 Tax=Nonomuraea sp. NBC_01738 TaxID=2976003 RepID=UPI002E126807|nr:DUF6292 family protein [Nonomuraea sp. NBC_01738]